VGIIIIYLWVGVNIMNKKTVIISGVISSPLCADNLQDSLLSMNVSVHIMLYISFIIISLGMLSSAYALTTSLTAYAACEEKNRNVAFI
jgi:hypothetical protein